MRFGLLDDAEALAGRPQLRPARAGRRGRRRRQLASTGRASAQSVAGLRLGDGRPNPRRRGLRACIGICAATRTAAGGHAACLAAAMACQTLLPARDVRAASVCAQSPRAGKDLSRFDNAATLTAAAAAISSRGCAAAERANRVASRSEDLFTTNNGSRLPETRAVRSEPTSGRFVSGDGAAEEVMLAMR